MVTEEDKAHKAKQAADQKALKEAAAKMKAKKK